MKLHARIPLLVLAASTLTAHAATYQWDANGATAGLGGTGTWNTANTTWDLTGSGGDTGTDATVAYTFTSADTALFAGTAGTVTLGAPVTLGGITLNTAGYTITADTITLAGATPTLNATQNGTIASTLAGTAGLTKSGTGNLTLTGASTYTGDTKLTAGTLTLSGGINRLGNAATLTLGSGTSGGTLVLAGVNQKFDTIAISGTGANAIRGGDNSNGKLLLANTNAVTLSATLGGSGTNENNLEFTKSGTGDVTFTAVNTYTGLTTILGGKLILDYTTTASSRIADTGAILLGGATLDLAGGTGYTEAVGNMSIAGINAITRSAGTSALQMGTITAQAQSAGGAMLDFGAGAIAKTTTANTNGILGSWAVINKNDFAANSAVSGLGDIVAYSAYTGAAIGGTIANGAGTNVSITGSADGSVTMAASGVTTINTLTSKLASARTATINLTGNTLRLGADGGVLAGKDYGDMIFTGGTLTAGGADNTAGTITFINHRSAKTISVGSIVANNGTGIVSLAKYGTGSLTLSAANTHTGVTYVREGVLALAHVNALQNSTLDNGSTSSQDVTFTVAGTNTYNIGGLQGGDVLTLGANAINVGANNASTEFAGALAGTGTVTKQGGGTLTLSGVNTHTGIVTITAGTLALGHTATLATATLDTGTSGAQAVTFTVAGTNTYTLGGLRGADALNLGANSVTVGAGNGSTTFSGVISGTGALTKNGTGTLTLTGTNDLSGGVTVAAGTMVTGNTAALGTGNAAVNSGATLQLGDGTTQTVTLGSGAALTVAGTLKLAAATSAIALTGAGGFNFTGGTINLNGVFDSLPGTVSYALITGGSGAKTAGATVTGYNSGIFSTVTFDNAGVLHFTAIPEPATFGLAGAGALAALTAVRRRRAAR